ncbi:MAG: hypothetical protein RSD26_03425 [Cellulosilyticaceae bacterium]
MYTNNNSKLVTVYKDAKERAGKHIQLLLNAKDNERIESDRILQYLQETIDCLKLCLDGLAEGSEYKKQYAMYKDELGELGEEIIKYTKINRW